MGKLQTLRSRLIAGALGVALLGAGVGVGAAASEPSSPDTRPVSDVSVPTTAATNTAAPTSAVPVVQAVPAAPTTAAETVEESAPAATVAAVTETQVAPPAVSDNRVGSYGSDGVYIPPPPTSGPGEPSYADPDPGVPAELLPGEVGYVPAG